MDAAVLDKGTNMKKIWIVGLDFDIISKTFIGSYAVREERGELARMLRITIPADDWDEAALRLKNHVTRKVEEGYTYIPASNLN